MSRDPSSAGRFPLAREEPHAEKWNNRGAAERYRPSFWRRRLSLRGELDGVETSGSRRHFLSTVALMAGAAILPHPRPVIISHTGLDTQFGSNPSLSQMMRRRLISEEHAEMVAAAGGVVGVWTHLSDTPPGTFERWSMSSGSIMYASARIPSSPSPAGAPAALALVNSSVRTPGNAPMRYGRVKNAGFYYVVVDAMLKTGFTPDEIGKIGGGNFLRIFGAAVRVGYIQSLR